VAVITVTGCVIFIAVPGFLVDPTSEPSTPWKGNDDVRLTIYWA
jgi:hypothetical protein